MKAIKIEGKYTTAIVFVDKLDTTTHLQIIQLVNHPAFTNKVRIMPDTHAGASNSVIGFTMPLTDKIIPNTVGVDIGCGMVSTKLDIKPREIDFAEIDRKIRQTVPIGNDKSGIHQSPIIDMTKDFPYEKATNLLNDFTKAYNQKFNQNFMPVEYNFQWFEKLCKRIGISQAIATNSLGTLGGGNHFIEIGKSSEDKSLWLTVHSGSRRLGKMIADYHSRIALDTMFEPYKKDIQETPATKGKKKRKKHKKPSKKEQRELFQKIFGFPMSMAYLEGQQMYDYFVDMVFAQVYASYNRHLMVNGILQATGIKEVSERIESVHNYIDFKDFIIRKGAIRSYEGEKMIIPFNMAEGLLICEGKSNDDWNFSAPHGAGRVMSRTQARLSLKLKDYQKIMQEKGVFSTSVGQDTIDEAPQVYKKPKFIRNAIEPTAKILFNVKPLYNLKAS